MKCLSRIDIQEYIDNEINQDDVSEIMDHLGNCEKCISLYKQALDEKETVIRLLRAIEPELIKEPIPLFIPPVGPITKKIYLPLVIKILAAASILGFIFLYRPQRLAENEKMMNSEILMNEFYNGKDLNKMWHEKSQIIIFQDEKGNVFQAIITN
jgi:hypothetical protein